MFILVKYPGLAYAAINAQNLTGDPGSFSADQKGRCRGYVFWFSQPAHVDAIQQLSLSFRAEGVPLSERGRIRKNEAWGNRINGDAVLAQLKTKLFGQSNQSVLGSCIGMDTRQARAQTCA